MYITETTNNVREIIESIIDFEDKNKLDIMMYIFEKIDNNLINSKNIENPNIGDNEDLEIFTLDQIGLSENSCTTLLQYLSMMYRGIYNQNVNYIDNHILGLEYDAIDKKVISKFERLTYNEKLDIISEIVIKFDNNTYFDKHFNELTFNSKTNGFELANLIQKFKIK